MVMSSYSSVADVIKKKTKYHTSRLILAGTLVFSAGVNIAQAADIPTLTAGSTPSSRPACFLDITTGKFEGFMPEIASEVARRAGFKITFNAIPFSALLQSLLTNKIDMIVAGMSPTAQRKTKVDFSEDVTSLGEGIFVRNDNKKQYKTAQDFKGEVIGIMAGADYGPRIAAMHVAKEVKFYESPADLAKDVQLGRISVGINDYPIIKGEAAAGSLKGMHVVESYQPTQVDPIAFAFRKGNEPLLLKVNKAIDSMKADGSLQKILNKWGMKYYAG
ncbi:MAG: ABC transporter substrate-binding protein [Pseudomonadota bacterium]